MLYCGTTYNFWVETALQYLPSQIIEEIEGKIAITMLGSDAFRLAQKIRSQEEVIVLAPWIFSFIPPGSCEADKEWRYLVFCVLHEIAHAFLKHSPPDELTGQEDINQEDEANRYALDWYNKYAQENIERGLTELIIEEVRETQGRYQVRLEQILGFG